MILCIIALLTVPAFGQEETLIGSEFHSGGYGGPEVRIGPMLGTSGVFVGGRGGWVINHTFMIGGGGYGLVNDVRVKDITIGGQPAYLGFGYGGMCLEFTGNSEKLIHYTIGVMIGGGGVEYRDSLYNFKDHNWDAVFVLEPSLGVEMNVTNFFRLGLGASYRYVSGVNTFGLTNKELSDATGTITLKFGTF
jgi:hypothetical protein